MIRNGEYVTCRNVEVRRIRCVHNDLTMGVNVKGNELEVNKIVQSTPCT